MCQATVYLLDEQIMADVMDVEVVADGVRLVSMFEDERVVPAAVRRIDLLRHVVVLEPLDGAQAAR